MQKRDSEGRIIRKPKDPLVGGEVIDKCEGCENQIVGLCTIYVNPTIMWRLGNCLMATHVVTRVKEEETKKRVGQQKQKIKR
ncbi:hypothetical protein LCGC14_0458770 [marine sediment metagenome]|uniref:Uncharacterized protein n=1 Tax=marine sediment metagenome TaxID=412755 RepID=A0A0F9SL06_9ZZZZ